MRQALRSSTRVGAGGRRFGFDRLLASAPRRVLRGIPVGAVAIALMLGLAAPSGAVEPGEVLADPNLEARARTISAGLRCLVCQNQSIDDSNAPLAKDLRLLVREQLKTGASDSAVVDYIVARYGDFVLLKPPLNSHTVILWLAPLLCLAGLCYGMVRALSGGGSNPPASSQALSEAEEKELRRLLDQR